MENDINNQFQIDNYKFLYETCLSLMTQEQLSELNSRIDNDLPYYVKEHSKVPGMLEYELEKYMKRQ